MNPLPIALFSLSLLLGACATTTASAGRDQLTANVGIYPPPAVGTQPVRIGVPAFQVAEGVEQTLSPLAADQVATLAANSQRFDVIERTQLDLLLQEQNLEGVVKGSELVQPAQVRGVEWLLIGKVTSLRVKRTSTGSSFNLGSVPVPGAFGAALGLFGVGNSDTALQVECGVDLRLVDPTTGAVLVADFSEFDRTDSASAMGLQILGGKTDSNASIELGADDQGRILRLALDDCLRKMLPRIDRALQQRANGPAGADAIAAVDTASFCSGCGTRLATGAQFCTGCGTKVKGTR